MRSHGFLFVNADCVRGAIAHLANSSVDLIVTDPPYGIEGDHLHRHYNRDETFVVGDYVEVPLAEYPEFTRLWIAQAARLLRPGGGIFVISGYTNLDCILRELRAAGLREINHIIWKYNFGVYTSRKFVSSHYHVLYWAKPGGKRTFNLQARFGSGEIAQDGGNLNYRDREDVWVIPREYKPGVRKNKNELPAGLLQKILAYGSDEGDLVCDLFAGGGSTGVTALGMNRRFVGFEISKAAFALAKGRLKKVRAGSMLADLRMPVLRSVGRQGAAWSKSERRRLAARYRQYVKRGLGKGVAIDRLCEDLQRGRWAISKALKREGF